MKNVIEIQDTQTKEIFTVPSYENVVSHVTKDGIRVRIHPLVLKTMVSNGDTFEAQGIVNKRTMRKLR